MAQGAPRQTPSSPALNRGSFAPPEKTVRPEGSPTNFTFPSSLPSRSVSSSSYTPGAKRTVAEAPWLHLGRRCGGWSVRAARARLEAFREAGVWTPSQATGADECPGACVFPRISPAFGNLYFDLSDAQVSFVDGDARTAFVGVSWTRAPVRIPGRDGAVQNRLSWLKGPIRDSAAADLAARGSDEWYELPGGIARLAAQGAPAGGAGSPSEPPPAALKPRAEPVEIGVIGGDDGPTSIWLSSKAGAGDLPPKEDMVEMFREFFETDPETAKAFFEAADAAKAGVAAPAPKDDHAEIAEPESHAEPAESAEPASGGASSPSEPPPAPAEDKPHAEPAAPAASGGASSPSEPPPAEEKPHAEPAAPAASGGASSPSEPPPAE